MMSEIHSRACNMENVCCTVIRAVEGEHSMDTTKYSWKANFHVKQVSKIILILHVLCMLQNFTFDRPNDSTLLELFSTSTVHLR